jgi:integrase
MPRTLNRLTKRALDRATLRERPYTLADGGGLVLLVQPAGARLWRFRYRYNGTPKMISFGSYPEVDLGAAREKRTEARKQVAAGIDPSAHRQARKAQLRAPAGETFKLVAEEYLLGRGDVDPGTVDTARRRLERHIYPTLGNTPVNAVSAPALLVVLREIEAGGSNETAHRTRALCSRVFRHAIATGRAKRDVAHDLIGALASKKQRNFAAIIEPEQFGTLLGAIEHYSGQPVTRLALQLLALTFVRPGELRLATWDEFTLDGKAPQWIVPAKRTKLRRDQIVPLATQTLTLLRQVEQHRRDDYVFPSLRKGRPISEGTMLVALRNLGYDGTVHVPHGFRASARTMLNEQLHFPREVIELQLAHLVGDQTERSYNRAKLLDQRRAMMQRWADYLDELVLVG